MRKSLGINQFTISNWGTTFVDQICLPPSVISTNMIETCWKQTYLKPPRSFFCFGSLNWNQFEECWLLPRTPTIPYHTHTQLPDHQKDVCCFITPIKNDPWNTFVNKTKLGDSTPPCTTPPCHSMNDDSPIWSLHVCCSNPHYQYWIPYDASITILLINYTPEYVKSLNPHEQNHCNHVKSPFSMAKSI